MGKPKNPWVIVTPFINKEIPNLYNYLKKILDEIENPDLDEFLDYVDTYYEVCLETTEKSKNIFKRFSEMLSRNSY